MTNVNSHGKPSRRSHDKSCLYHFLTRPGANAPRDTSDMRSSQKSSPSPSQGPAYDHTSIELDGWEVTVGKSGHELNAQELLFTDAILERFADLELEGSEDKKRRVDTRFSAHVSPRSLVEFHASSENPHFRAMCSRGVELLGAEPGRISFAARRVADAADIFLRRSDNRDPVLKSFALNVRLRARQTLQDRLAEATQPQGATVSREEGAALMATRAMAMAEYFGVHDATSALGVHFILDARGNPAFAFKPMTARAAARAVCTSRLHDAFARALSGAAVTASGRSAPSALSAPSGWIVRMPVRSAGEAEDVGPRLGLLMRSPPGFRLRLSHPLDSAEVVQQRLAQASTRALDVESFEHLALTAACAGKAGPDMDGVLVDEGGRAWQLDHVGSLADRPAGGGSSGRRPPEAVPMSYARLRALAELEDSGQDPSVAWQPVDRERDLLAEAVGREAGREVDPETAAASDRLWPTKEEIDALRTRVSDLSLWAAQCVRGLDALEQLSSAEDTVLQYRLMTGQSSIQWYLNPSALPDDIQA